MTGLYDLLSYHTVVVFVNMQGLLCKVLLLVNWVCAEPVDARKLKITPPKTSATQFGPYKGLGQRKKVFLESGGSIDDLAIAMVNTPLLLPIFPVSAGDPGEFGLFHTSWALLRGSKKTEFSGRPEQDWQHAYVLNTEPKRDIAAFHAIYKELGRQGWARAHLPRRSSKKAIKEYLKLVDRIRTWLIEGHHTNDDFSYQ